MILPGDILWDRFRVMRVETERTGCAWLAPINASGTDDPRSTHLLLSLEPTHRSALGDLLAVLWRGLNVPVENASDAVLQNGESQAQLPLIGNVDWRGNPDLGGVVLLESVPEARLEFIGRASMAKVVPAALKWIAELASSLERLLTISSAGRNGSTDFCRVASKLLNPSAVSMSKDVTRFIFSTQIETELSPLAPPLWTLYAAPEAIAGDTSDEATLVFGVAQIAFALLVGVSHSDDRQARGWKWLASPDSVFKEFKLDPRVGKMPKEVQALLAKCLRPLPANRFATLAKFRAALKKVLRVVGESNDAEALPFSSQTIEKPAVAIPPGMKWISAGPYLAGEKKLPRTLRAFAIDETPVTERDYREFLKAMDREPYPDGPGSRGPKFDKHPVVNITWREAEEFAEHYGKRLPTAYEWEKASRGNDGRKFPYGNEYLVGTGRMRAAGINTAPGKEAIKETAAVSSFPKGASPYGMLDAAGNVLEWTSTARRLGERIFRALKGACFLDGSVELSRCTAIQYKSPNTRENFVGFRCVKDVD